MMAEGSAAEGQSGPERDRVCSIRRHRGNAGKQQGWKRDEASAPGDRVQRPSEHGGKKQQHSIVGKVSRNQA